MKKDLYRELGVDKKASKKEIKKAFRKKAKEAHPDKGGKREEFESLQHAYTVLINDSMRKQYDETGDDSAPKRPAEEQSIAVFINVVMSILREQPHTDVLATAKEALCQERDRMIQEIRNNKGLIEMKRDQASRFSRIDGGESLVSNALNHSADELEGLNNGLSQRVKVVECAINLTREYRYSFKKVARAGWSTTGTFMQDDPWVKLAFEDMTKEE